MAFQCKGLVKCSLLVLIIVSGQNSLCSIEGEEMETFQNNDNKTKSILGEYCWETTCSENQYCNEILKCECRPGFINRHNICVPCAGENEECLTSSDCSESLFCINGVCRKATPNAEYITLAKICLGITIISTVIAVLSYILKCLLRFYSFRRFSQCRNPDGTNSINIQGGHVLESQSPPIRILEEKPPSYEECMLQGQRSSFADSPPPYVISSNEFTTNKQNYVFPVLSQERYPEQ